MISNGWLWVYDVHLFRRLIFLYGEFMEDGFFTLKATQICYQLYHGCDGWAWEDAYWLSFNGMGLSLRSWWWWLDPFWPNVDAYSFCEWTVSWNHWVWVCSTNILLFIPWVSFLMPGFWWWFFWWKLFVFTSTTTPTIGYSQGYDVDTRIMFSYTYRSETGHDIEIYTDNFSFLK